MRTAVAATSRHEEEATASSLYMTGAKWHRRIMTRESTFSELVVERTQYLLKLQSGKLQNTDRLVTAKCRRQMSCCQSLDAFVESPTYDKCVWRPGSARTHWGSFNVPPRPLSRDRGRGPTSKGKGEREERRRKGKRKGEWRGKWRVRGEDCFLFIELLATGLMRPIATHVACCVVCG